MFADKGLHPIIKYQVTNTVARVYTFESHL